MPVVLHDKDYDAWLDVEVDIACALAQPFPSQLMAVKRAARLFHAEDGLLLRQRSGFTWLGSSSTRHLSSAHSRHWQHR